MSCINCKSIINKFETVGKTYYLLNNNNVICFRHWHQANRPNYIISGDYSSVMEAKKYRTSKLSRMLSACLIALMSILAISCSSGHKWVV